MGFFDRPVENGFDKLFDFDRDGSLNTFEQALELDYLLGDDDTRMDDDDYDERDEMDKIQDEIEGMDYEEAVEYIESEGYDADDFDF